MMKHIPSNTTFENRKQAIKCMGKFIYDRELKKCNFLFLNNETANVKKC